MQLHLGKVYRLRDGTVLGPLSPFDVGGGVSFYTCGVSEHCWHPATGKETSGFTAFDIVSEVYVTPAIILFNEE